MKAPLTPERNNLPLRSFFGNTRNRIAMLAMLGTSLSPTCKSGPSKSPDDVAWGDGDEAWADGEDWDGEDMIPKVAKELGDNKKHVKVLVVSDNNFQAEVLGVKDKPVLVDFWAPWCPPCKPQALIIEQVVEELGDKAVFTQINADKNPSLANRYGAYSLPALRIFKDGEVVYSNSGIHSKELLLHLLKKNMKGK